jgi:hypothetical protein
VTAAIIPLFDRDKPSQGRLPGVEYEPAGPEPCVLSPSRVTGLLDLFEVIAALADNPQMFTAAQRRDIKGGLAAWVAVLLGEDDPA